MRRAAEQPRRTDQRGCCVLPSCLPAGRDSATHGTGRLRRRTPENGSQSGDFVAALHITAALGAAVYFARPYHSWERGLNENTNGLVRQFFPKGLDLGPLTGQDVRRVERLLNTRPRKTLGYRTPLEMLAELGWP